MEKLSVMVLGLKKEVSELHKIMDKIPNSSDRSYYMKRIHVIEKKLDKISFMGVQSW